MVRSPCLHRTALGRRPPLILPLPLLSPGPESREGRDGGAVICVKPVLTALSSGGEQIEPSEVPVWALLPPSMVPVQATLHGLLDHAPTPQHDIHKVAGGMNRVLCSCCSVVRSVCCCSAVFVLLLVSTFTLSPPMVVLCVAHQCCLLLQWRCLVASERTSYHTEN